MRYTRDELIGFALTMAETVRTHFGGAEPAEKLRAIAELMRADGQRPAVIPADLPQYFRGMLP